jgi:hypothetical protein
MTIELVLSTHRDVFYRALLEEDWDALATLYADEYMLVRSDGSVLTKDEVLADLRTQKLSFESIEVSDEKLRIIDSVAVLTGQSWHSDAILLPIHCFVPRDSPWFEAALFPEYFAMSRAARIRPLRRENRKRD